MLKFITQVGHCSLPVMDILNQLLTLSKSLIMDGLLWTPLEKLSDGVLMVSNNTLGRSTPLQQICQYLDTTMDIIMLDLILEVQFSNITLSPIPIRPQEFITLRHLTYLSQKFNIPQEILTYMQLQTHHMFINMIAAQEITLQHICTLITQLLIWTLFQVETNKLFC